MASTRAVVGIVSGNARSGRREWNKLWGSGPRTETGFTLRDEDREEARCIEIGFLTGTVKRLSVAEYDEALERARRIHGNAR